MERRRIQAFGWPRIWGSQLHSFGGHGSSANIGFKTTPSRNVLCSGALKEQDPSNERGVHVEPRSSPCTMSKLAQGLKICEFPENERPDQIMSANSGSPSSAFQKPRLQAQLWLWQRRPLLPCRREGAGGALTRVPAADTDFDPHGRRVS